MKLIDIVGTPFTVRQFYSTEYDREYDVYVIQSASKKIVLKKTLDQNEINVYGVLKNITHNIVPNIYFIDKEHHNLWIAMEYIEEKNSNIDRSGVKLLVKKLANIHSLYGGNTKELTNLNQWTRKKDEELNKLADANITQKQINIIKESQEILKKSKSTLIHGDLIPLNIIVSFEEDIKIIDWETGKRGPYILDIGRLLGDYNKTKPWINVEWENDILKTYYDSLDKDLFNMTYKQFLLEYQCSKLNNYLGIVSAHINKKWDRTEWYQLNLAQLNKSIQNLEILLKRNLEY